MGWRVLPVTYAQFRSEKLFHWLARVLPREST